MSSPTAAATRTASTTALAAVDRQRRLLSATLWLRAVLAGAVVALAVLLGVRLAVMAGAPSGAMAVAGAPWLALVAGLLAAAALRWRGGRVDRARTALWMEEQAPRDFLLVTAAEPQDPSVLALLEARLGRRREDAAASRAMMRAVAVPAIALVVVGAALFLLPTVSAIGAARSSRGASAGAAGAGGARAAAGLGPVTVTVRPPAYSGLPTSSERDPESMAVLVGSSVRVAGSTTGTVEAGDGVRAVQVARDGDDWSLSLAMPDSVVVARLMGGGQERLLLLTPIPDSIPIVTLAAAVRDTVLPAPAGTISLSADATDDLGLVDGWFEYIVSSGEGESFTFQSGTLGMRSLAGARRATLTGELRLDALKLKAGDLVHLRALARDGNTVSGPGVGSSETRTIRIARPGEGDSLAVDGAPPPALDTAALSQRMLLEQTIRLQEQRPRLTRDTVLVRAGRISVDQTRLRKRVGELVYTRLGDDVDGEHSHFAGDGHDHGEEGKLDVNDILARASAATGGEPEALDFHGDETPVVAVNKPLLEAYNHMWDATRALDLGEPGDAIPPMQKALEALQRARQAERIYLRGRPPTVVVDIARARLQGKTTGESNVRTARQATDPAAAARAERLERALRLLADPRQRAAATDSLLLVQADALRSNPSLATALGTALGLLRTGEDATGALQRARRAAAPEPARQGGLTPWGTTP